MHEPFLFHIALMLIAAKIGGEICERWLKQPAVLGELVGGVLLGQSLLGWVDGESHLLQSIAEIGAILLLFEVGLESQIEDLFKVGKEALWVAVAGVTLPFVFGYLVAHALGLATMQAIFVGATLTATSVGITARVFSDLNCLHTREAKIVLGAAIADDVIGLIILAAVSALAATKTISLFIIGKVTGLAALFLVGAIAIGLPATPYILRWASKMQTRAAVSSAAIIFCLLLATLAEKAGLAAIVGAFAAGLVLDKVDDKVHIEHKIKALADLFVPVFFVFMGVRMNVQTFNPMTDAGRTTLIMGGALLFVGVVGKVLGGITLPGKQKGRLLIGVGMIPRGEVGLIFASVGLQNRVIEGNLYAAIVFVVIVSTFMTPPLLRMILLRSLPKGGEKGALPPDTL